MYFYHVTNLQHYHEIKANHQMIPRIGQHSLKIGETTARIYLFNTYQICQDAVTNWLGDEFADTDTLVYLKIKLKSDDKALKYQPNVSESYYYQPIPINQIQLIQTEPPA